VVQDIYGAIPETALVPRLTLPLLSRSLGRVDGRKKEILENSESIGRNNTIINIFIMLQVI